MNNQDNQEEEAQEPEPQDPPKAQTEDNGPTNMLKAMEAAFNRMAQGSGERREESRAASVLRQAKTMDPPTFKGDEEPIESARWINKMETIFKTLRIQDADLRIVIATFYLRGDAEDWWKGQEELNVENDLSWIEFKELFLDEFFPDILREKKREIS